MSVDTATTPENETPAEVDPAEEPTEETPPPAALGDAGKQALDRMKAERNEARKQARETATALAALKAAAEGKEAEHAAEMARREAETAALSKANERILKAEIRATAAGKLADPMDALRLIDLDQFEVSDDGEIDSELIAQAIDDLLKKKPYLAAQGGRRFQGTADGGARKDARPAQLTRADLAGMKPEQIEAARVEGRLNDLLGIKQ